MPNELNPNYADMFAGKSTAEPGKQCGAPPKGGGIGPRPMLAARPDTRTQAGERVSGTSSPPNATPHGARVAGTSSPPNATPDRARVGGTPSKPRRPRSRTPKVRSESAPRSRDARDDAPVTVKSFERQEAIKSASAAASAAADGVRDAVFEERMKEFRESVLMSQKKIVVDTVAMLGITEYALNEMSYEEVNRYAMAFQIAAAHKKSDAHQDRRKPKEIKRGALQQGVDATAPAGSCI